MLLGVVLLDHMADILVENNLERLLGCFLEEVHEASPNVEGSLGKSSLPRAVCEKSGT
jgi:hypothetical protein